MDAGGLQWLDEAAGQAQGDDVLVPVFPAPSGDEAEPARVGQTLAIQTLNQGVLGVLVGDEVRAIDIAVAGAVLQGDAPLPAGLARRGRGPGAHRLDLGAGHRDRPVHRQPVRPVFIAGLERPLDQQAAKAGTVDEQVRLQHAPVLQRHALDKAVVRPLGHIDDLALDPLHAASLTDLAEVAAVKDGIEMIGGEQAVQRRARVGGAFSRPALQRGLGAHRIGGQIVCQTTLAQHQPALWEIRQGRPASIGAERMEVTVALAAPVNELDGQFDRGLGLAHEFGLVEPDHGVEIANGRHGRLAHANDADLGRLDQPDLGVRSDGTLQRRRRHPAGSAPADDQDRFDRWGLHCRIISRAVITRMISLVPSKIRWTRRSRTIRSSG